MDVHRKFADAPITFPVPVRSSAGPADDFAIDLRNNGGITTSDGLKPRLLIFRRSPTGFIGGDAVLDALIVNYSNRRGILYGGGSNVHAVQTGTFARVITPVPLIPLLHQNLVRTPAALRATATWLT